MKVASCSIICLENNYLREFVEYQKNIGFDTVFIYDHNTIEDPTDVIGDFIKSGFVKLISWKSHKVGPAVMEAFQDCLDNNRNEYDWILFCDIDEYLTLVKDNNVKEYLSRSVFNNVNIIKINWMNFDDNEELTYKNIPQHIRFTHPCNSDPLSFFENRHIKCFINCKAKNVEMIDYLHGGAHCPNRFIPNELFKNNKNFGFYNYKLVVVNNEGNLLNFFEQRRESKIRTINFNLAYLKHFRFKTIEEYCTNKIQKLTLLGYKSYNFNYINFCKYNTHTISKLNIFRKYNEKNFPDIKCLAIVNLSDIKILDIDIINSIEMYVFNCFNKIIVINDQNRKLSYLNTYVNMGIIEIINKKCSINEIENKYKNEYNFIISNNIDKIFNLKQHISIQHYISDYIKLNNNE